MAVTTASFSLLTSKVFDGESLTSLLEFKDTDGDSSFSITSSALSNGSCISKRLFSQTLLLFAKKKANCPCFHVDMATVPHALFKISFQCFFHFIKLCVRPILKVWRLGCYKDDLLMTR